MGFLIAFADDASVDRELYSDYLERAGHRVVTYPSGTALYMRLLTDQPDLIVTDLQMPPGDLGGMWLIEQVRQGDRTLPIIVLSGQGSIPLALKAVDMGGPYTRFVTKSQPDEELLLNIHAMMQDVRNHTDLLEPYIRRLEGYPFWHKLTSIAQRSLANAEYLFHSHVGTHGFDFSGAMGAYFKALELELHNRVVPVLKWVSAKQEPLHVGPKGALHEYKKSVDVFELVELLKEPRLSELLRAAGVNLSEQTLCNLADDINYVRRERNRRVHLIVDEEVRQLEEVRARLLGIGGRSIFEGLGLFQRGNG